MVLGSICWVYWHQSTGQSKPNFVVLGSICWVYWHQSTGQSKPNFVVLGSICWVYWQRFTGRNRMPAHTENSAHQRNGNFKK